MDKVLINAGQSSHGWGHAVHVIDCLKRGGLSLIYPTAESSNIYFAVGTFFHELMAHTRVQLATEQSPIYVDGKPVHDPSPFCTPLEVMDLYRGTDKLVDKEKGGDYFDDTVKLYWCYQDYYKLRDQSLKTVAIETVMSVEMPAPDGSLECYSVMEEGKLLVHTRPVVKYKYTKRVDWVYKEFAHLYVVDYKTTYSMGPEHLEYVQMDGGFHGQVLLGQAKFGQNFGGVIADMARKFNGRNKHPAFERVPVLINNPGPFMQAYVYHMREMGFMAARESDPNNWPGAYSANGGGASPCNRCCFRHTCMKHAGYPAFNEPFNPRG